MRGTPLGFITVFFTASCVAGPIDGGDELAEASETGDGDGDPGDGDGDGDGDPGDGDGDGDPGDDFGNGEDDCAGPELPEQCDELASAAIEVVNIAYAGDDDQWNPGEDLVVTVLFGATDIQVNYPALVSQSNHEQVTVAWITGEYFAAIPDLEPLEHTVIFSADPALEPGTEVALKIGAAAGLGQLTACDCPNVTTDAWIESFTII